MSENFSALNDLERNYLEKSARTSSGLWKLSLLHIGIQLIPDIKVTQDSYWSNLENKALRWIKIHPNTSAAYLTYANILMRRAFSYRGTGWGHEVREENWAPFYDYIDKAKQVLIDSKEISATDPHWYEIMLAVAKYQSWGAKEFEVLVDEATNRYPDYYQIYFGAIDYLAAKAVVVPEEIDEIASLALLKTKHTDNTGMYSRIYWYASQREYGNDLFTKSAVDWSKMSSSIDDVLAQYPDQWNINNFAYFSCLAGDPHKTKSLIDRILKKPIIEAWGDSDFYYRCKLWAHAATKNSNV